MKLANWNLVKANLEYYTLEGEIKSAKFGITGQAAEEDLGITILFNIVILLQESKSSYFSYQEYVLCMDR